MRLRPSVILLAAWVGAWAVPRVSYAQAPTSAPGIDFPPEDRIVWGSVERGLKHQAAERQLARAPESPETVAMLLEAHRPGPALDVLRRIVERRPERLADALRAASRHAGRFEDDGRGYPAAIRDIVVKSRQRLRELSREEAADAAWSLAFLNMGGPDEPDVPWRDQLRQFTETWSGTEAGLRAELRRLDESGDVRARIEAYQAYARSHAGTILGAYALYNAARNLAWNTREPQGSDPTERLLRVAALARELQSGAYPDCEWVRGAPDLVLRFSGTNPRYAKENLPRVLAVFREFLLKPFDVDPVHPLGSGSGYFIAKRLPEIFSALDGDPVARADDFLRDLEPDGAGAAAARYVRALWYRQLAAESKDAEKSKEWHRRGAAGLLELARAGGDLYNRKALASLAAMAFNEKDCGAAVGHYREYLSRFPRTDWAWVAGLRVGQCEQLLGNWTRARQAYQSVTSLRGVPAPALVLGHTFAGRASEALDDFRGARAAYERADRAWDRRFVDDYAGTYQFYTRLNEEQCGCDDRSKVDVSREWLQRRSTELQQSLRVPGGPLLERGRFRVAQEDWQNAALPLEEFIRLYPDSPNVGEARNLRVRAKLEILLAAAGPEANEDQKRARLAALEPLTAEPYGFSVFAAQMTRATLESMVGSDSRAEELMSSALSRWHEHGAARFAKPSPTPLERDVLEIRDAVFRPHVTWPRHQFNELRSSDAPSPFFIATPDVLVRLHDDSRVRVDAASRLAPRPGALILDEEQIAVLERILTSVCGPADGSKQIQRFWNRFFTMGPGHWGGWIVETLPIVWEISFIDAARTRGGARLRTGYAGHTQLLTRENGGWKLGATRQHWME